jgi:hypothetical protein
MNRLAVAAAAPSLLAASPAMSRDCSGSITTGGTAQNAIATPSGMQQTNGFSICNIDPSAGSSEPLWIDASGTATVGTGSIPLSAPTATTYAASNNCYSTPTSFASKTALSVLAATTSHEWSCWTW